MVSQARSQRLVYALLTGPANSPAFTCPQNAVTLVKWFQANNNAATAAVVHVVFSKAVIGGNMFLATTSVPPNSVFVQEGWAAIHPGDQVYVYCESGTCAVYLSGAILNGGPQVPAADMQVPRNVPPLADVMPAGG